LRDGSTNVGEPALDAVGVEVRAGRIANAVIVEAKSRNASRGQAVGEVAERAVRARVLVPDRAAEDRGAVARRRGFIDMKPSEAGVRAMSDV
jgi:hypothetical protein